MISENYSDLDFLKFEKYIGDDNSNVSYELY